VEMLQDCDKGFVVEFESRTGLVLGMSRVCSGSVVVTKLVDDF